MAFDGTFEDSWGLASNAGSGSTRGTWIINPSDGSDLYIVDAMDEFKFLSEGESYSQVINTPEGTIESIVTFTGTNANLVCKFNCSNLNESETWNGLFDNDTIAWDTSSMTNGSEGFIGNVPGFKDWSKGNVGDNPHKKDMTFLKDTPKEFSIEVLVFKGVSGKTYILGGFMLAEESKIVEIMERSYSISDGRICYYKAGKVDEWNEYEANR